MAVVRLVKLSVEVLLPVAFPIAPTGKDVHSKPVAKLAPTLKEAL